MTETLKTSKGWRNEQNLNHNFVSHSPGRSAVFSPRCVELSKALPGSTWSAPHDLGFVSETFQAFFVDIQRHIGNKKSESPEAIQGHSSTLSQCSSGSACRTAAMAVSNVAGSGQWITALDVTTEAEVMSRVKKQGDPAGKDRRKTMQI